MSGNLKTPLDYALFYADLGWSVFPVHSIKDEKCTCGKSCISPGKHPMLAGGFKVATTDKQKISKWWEIWSNANIGIATGKMSGIVALDIDEGGELPINEKDLPDTIEQITGSGNRHVLFKYPENEDHLSSKSHVWEHVDTRADGGYIVAPPSIHESGNVYQWEVSSDPADGVKLTDCPEWLLERIRPQKIIEYTESELDELPENIKDILSFIPADDYETWYTVGAGLLHAGADFSVFNEWSKNSKKYTNELDTLKKWKSLKNYDGKKVGIGTVRKLAENYGFVDPAIKHGAKIIKNLLKNRQIKEAEKIKKAKENFKVPCEVENISLMPGKNNLISKLAEIIIESSVYPQPDLAVAASVSFLGALIGRKFQTPTGLRSNVYIVGLAESGTGKDHARKIINKLAHDAGIDEFIGGDRIASGQGLISAMGNHYSKVFLIDEFGHFLKSVGSSADSHRRDIITTIMQFYSTANSVFKGTEYADQKNRPRIEIPEPNLCIYGTSTHGTFFDSLSSNEAVDGTISRLLVVDAGSKRPDAVRRPKLYKEDLELCNFIREIALGKSEGNLSGYKAKIGNSDGGVFDVATVQMTQTAEDSFFDLADYAYKLATCESSRSVYSRVAENAAKLALIHAVCRYDSEIIIDDDSFTWGSEFALYSANKIVAQINNNIADNDFERNYKKIENLIRESGEKGITKRAFGQKVRSIKGQELKDIMSRLLDNDMILELREQTKGRTTIKYLWVGE